MRRLNERATAGFLERPPVPLDHATIGLSWAYLQEIRMLNRLVDSIDNPTAPDHYVRARIGQALGFQERIKKSGSNLFNALAALLRPNP